MSIFNFVKWLLIGRSPDIVYRETERERESVGIGKKNAPYKTLFVYEIIHISILRLHKETITHSNIFKHQMHTHIHINTYRYTCITRKMYNEKRKENFKYNLKIAESTATFWRPQMFAPSYGVTHTARVKCPRMANLIVHFLFDV